MPGFVDAAVVNGTAYGYAVSAFGAGGESAVSSSVVVTPVAPEPEPEAGAGWGAVGWFGVVVGCVGVVVVVG